MRLFVVIPHYCGPADPANSSPHSASYGEPLSRIAALSETITSLHRNFGPYRSTLEGTEIARADGVESSVVDIAIVTMHGRNVLAELGTDSGVYTVEYVEGPPTQIPFHAPRLIRERLGHYDFYSLLEHDLAIHDPEFFAKLIWFQKNFGCRSLLAPTRVETASSGTPGKVIIDPILPTEALVPFRRPGQRAELVGEWNGQERRFCLPTNPHAASYFLTQDQLAHWIAQPAFDDHDASWVGPVESAVTLGIGKAFDIYKSVWPDPFFLEVHHFGTAFAATNPPHGRRYGEPPLLAIAERALRVALDPDRRAGNDSLSEFVKESFAQGTMGEIVAQLTRTRHERYEFEAKLSALSGRTNEQMAALTSRIAASQDEIVALTGEIAALTDENAALANENAAMTGEIPTLRGKLADLGEALAQTIAEMERRPRSLRWLLRSTLLELSRRIRSGAAVAALSDRPRNACSIYNRPIANWGIP